MSKYEHTFHLKNGKSFSLQNDLSGGEMEKTKFSQKDNVAFVRGEFCDYTINFINVNYITTKEIKEGER